MSYRATPPRLKGYKPLYKGRRYWVFKNDPANPFEIDPTSPYGKWTTDSDILVYHREFDALAACGEWIDGVIQAETLWGQGVTFQADSYANMAAHVGWIEKAYFD